MTATTPVVAPAPRRSRARGRPTPTSVFVGRGEELGRLRGLAAGAPSLALVHGEAGVGKSRLVRELADGADSADRRLLWGHCHSLTEPFPLGPFIEALAGIDEIPPAMLLSPLLGTLRPLLPEWARHLPPDPGFLSDPRAQRHRVFRALRALLCGLGPALCILEDLQWADEETLEFLVFLATALPPELAIVLTCRTAHREPGSAASEVLWGLLPAGRHSAVALTALTPEDVRALGAPRLGAETMSVEFAGRLHEWTAGLPSAVVAVLDHLQSAPELAALAQHPSRAPDVLPLPAVVGEPLVAVYGGLSENARLIASAAAVAGHPSGEEVLRDLAGLRIRAGTAGLVEALAAGVLTEHENGAYGFRHGIAARAVHQTISGPQRRRLHERAARALQRAAAPGTLADLAHHLEAAGSERWPRYAEAAAMEAIAAGDDEAAARLLEDVLSSCELSRAARIRMVLALGDAALYGVTTARAIAILRATLEEEELPAGVRGEVRFSLSRLLGHAGDDDAARIEATRAVGELRRRPALAVRAMINLAQSAGYGDGKPDERLVWLDRAVRTAGRQTDRVAQIAVSAQRAAILLSLGDPSGWTAVRDIPAARDIPEERLQLSRGYRALADAAVGLGHLKRAERFLVKAELLHGQAGNRSWGLWLEASRTSLNWCSGRWDGLEARLRGLLSATAPTPALALGSRYLLGALLLARGETDDAGAILSSVLETAHRGHDLGQIVPVSGQVARLHLDRGDPRAALDVLAPALAVVRAGHVWIPARSVIPEAVQALLACGRRDDARELASGFAAGLGRRDAPAARAALATCRGLLAEADMRPAEAARHFARADAGWGGLPNPYEAARARERTARCTEAGSGKAAEDLLFSARRAFDELDADADARRIRSQLKACGAWRGGRTGYGERLSPREAQVAGLAGGGLSNRDIAEALCISPRTVEIHVAASLRKLRLRSRHDLGHEQRARQRYVDHV